MSTIIGNGVIDPLQFKPIAKNEIFVIIDCTNSPDFTRNVATLQPVSDRDRTFMTFKQGELTG